MKQIALLALGAFALTSMTSTAKDMAKPSQYEKSLSSVPPIELPAKAAGIVKQAKAREWGKRTVEVVQASTRINPAGAPATVGAISKAVPDMAPIAASTAALEQPKQAPAIAKAAAAAAPSKAGRIVAAVCRELPDQHVLVATAVAEAVPTAGKEILTSVASAVPAAKPGIERALSKYQGTVPPVAVVLNQAGSGTPVANNSGTAAGPLPKGPTQGAPYVAPSGTPENITPATSGVVPPGGRGYAEP